MDNLSIWDSWAKTPPQFTKKVSIGARQFIAITPYWQFEQATRIFGPVGSGWGWDTPDYQILKPGDDIGDTLLILKVTLWYIHDEIRAAIPLENVAELYQWRKSENRYVIDDEAWKKLLTDTLTKGLSYLGCSADIFMGLYDDNKYVARMKAQKWDDYRHQWAGDATPPPTPQNGAQSDSTAPGTAQAPEAGDTAPDAKSSTSKTKKQLWEDLVKMMDGIGILPEMISGHIKTQHGWDNLKDVPVPYLQNLFTACERRVKAYDRIVLAAKFIHGAEWQDFVSDIVDQIGFDVLETEPSLIEKKADDLEAESRQEKP